MKILVTGAGGFLGKAFCRILQRDHDVVGITSQEVDLTQPDALKYLDDLPFNRIYHLAALTQPGDFARLHKGDQFIVNSQIDLTVLTWWLRHQPKAKLVSIGTSAAYAPELETCEENYLRGAPVKDLYVYAMVKRSLLEGQRALHEQYGLTHLTLVPSALYGPGYPATKKRRNLVLDIAWKILSHKHHGTDIVLWGDGTQVREAVFVDDFVHAAIALDAQVDNEVVNIGAGHGFTITEFAHLACELAGVDPSVIQYDTSGFVGAKSKFLNCEKLDTYLPERQHCSLRDGLMAVLEDLEPLVLASTPTQEKG